MQLSQFSIFLSTILIISGCNSNSGNREKSEGKDDSVALNQKPAINEFAKGEKWSKEDYVNFVMKIKSIDSTEYHLLPSLKNSDSSDFMACVDTANIIDLLSAQNSTQKKLELLEELYTVPLFIIGKYSVSKAHLIETTQLTAFMFTYQYLMLDILKETPEKSDIYQEIYESDNVYTGLNGIVGMVDNWDTSLYSQEQLLSFVVLIENAFKKLYNNHLSEYYQNLITLHIESVEKNSNVSTDVYRRLKGFIE